MPVPCKLCDSAAMLKRAKTSDALCKECFFQAFEVEVHNTITDNQLFTRGDFVAIAASGGKAYIIKLLNERHDYGIRLVLLSIDEGITGYRDDSLQVTQVPKTMKRSGSVRAPSVQSLQSISVGSFDDHDENDDRIETVVDDESMEGSPDISRTELFVLLKPLLFFMQIAGCFFINGFTISLGCRMYWSRINSKYWKFHLLLIGSIHVAALITNVFGIPHYVNVKGKDIQFVSVSLMSMTFFYIIQNCLNLQLYYRLCANNRLAALFQQYSILAEDRADRRALDNYLRFVQHIILGACLIFSALNCFGNWLTFFLQDPAIAGSSFNVLTIFRILPNHLFNICRVIWMFFVYAGPPVWSSCMGFYVFFCLAAFRSFKIFNHQLEDKFRMAISNGIAVDEHVVEHFRRRHQDLVKFVLIINDTMGSSLLMMYFFTFLEVCWTVYFTLFFCDQGFSKMFQVLWASCGIMLLGVVSVMGARLNVEAHKSFIKLQEADLATSNIKRLVLLTLFMCRTTGPGIGISGMGFFTITTKFATWVLSSFYSYFFLLMQFSPPRDFCDKVNGSTTL